MMRAAWTMVLVAMVVGVSGCGPAGGRDGADAASGVEVRDPWSRPSPAGATVGAAYVTLQSAVDDRLVEVRVSPSVAARAEMHEVLRDSAGEMRMQQVPAIDLPAGRRVELRPGSHHLMLMEMPRPLVEGDLFDLTLRFEKAGEQTVAVPVRRP